MELTRDQYAWTNNKPVLFRLPENNYQDNLVAIWLTSWVDEKLSEVRNKLQDFHKELSPDTCSTTSLDYLACLLGFTDVYWDTKYSEEVKRGLLRNVKELWQYRGTKRGILLALALIQVDATIWLKGTLVLPLTLSQTFSTNNLKMYLRLPLKYPENGYHFLQANRVVQGYAPVLIEVQVVYEYFYCGFSKLGQPLFKETL